MTEHLDKKTAEEEEMETQPQSNDAPSDIQNHEAVDTGKKVDVSKVILKKNMVRVVSKPSETPVEPVSVNDIKTTIEARPAPIQRQETPRRPVHNKKPRPKQKEIEVVRRPHIEHGQHSQMQSKAEDVQIVARPEPTVWDDSGDFSSMLDEASPIDKMQVSIGDRFRCRLIHVAGDTAFFSFASRYEGSMSLSELRRDTGEFICQVGDELDAYVVGLTNGIMLSLKMGKNMADLGMLEEARSSGIPVEGTVSGVNSGGYDIAIGGARGFCPLGQIDVEFIQEPKTLIGRTFLFLVTKIGEGGRNIVLNRRKHLEHERKKRLTERLKTLNVGDRVSGTVVRLADFGAFIDLNGAEGLVPNSEIAFNRVTSASERLNVGDIVEVEVLKIEPDPKREGNMRIGLSLKAAMPDPFLVHADKILPGQNLEGKVARLETFGAFIELFDGIDGLIHISELSDKRVSHPSEILQIGDPITVRVLDFDQEKRRVSLSLRENVERERDREKVSIPTLNRGTMVEGVVERIERYGVFLKLSNGQTALLPSPETGTPRGADLSKFFELGSTLQTMVIEVDERGRVRVSKTAREKADERAVFDKFDQKQKRSSTGFGTLGDLLKDIKVNKA